MSVEINTGGSLAARALTQVGLKTLFTLPGSHIGQLLERIRAEGKQVISVRHEENAILMAEGWALATGRPGFAAVTAGPGLANALPGIAEANAAGVPILVLAGRTALGRRGRGAVQDMNQLAAVEPITKWRGECLEAGRIGEYIVRAYMQATSGSPGVAYLEIAEDLLSAPVGEVTTPQMPKISRAVPEGAALAEALQLLRSAERPIVLAGSGAFFSGADPELEEFCEVSGIPATTTSAARGLLDDDHPLCLGSLVHGGAALISADLALVIGSGFNANLMYGRPPLFGEEQIVIQLDIAAEKLGGERVPNLGLVGDVAATLHSLAESWEGDPDRYRDWRVQAKAVAATSREIWTAETEAEGAAVHAGWLAREVAERFEEEGSGIWISDGGDSVTWGIAFSKGHRPGSNMLIGSAMGTLGVGLPFAIAAKLANPKALVVLFTGDGAFGFSAMELHTAARQGLGLLVVVVNNGVWRGPGSSKDEPVGDVDHGALAVALGGWGERVAVREELSPALDRALAAARSGLPAVLDVRCDPRVVSNLLRGLDDLGLM